MGVPTNTPIERVQIPIDKPTLALAICKQLWIEGKRSSAFNQLKSLTATIHRLIDLSRLQFNREQLEANTKLTAKCYLKLGEWHSQMHPPLSGLINNVTPARVPLVYLQQTAFQQAPQFYRNIPLQWYFFCLHN